MKYIRKLDGKVSNQPGPLESYAMAEHCEMCGAHPPGSVDGKWSTIRLEPAFNTQGEAKTLCYNCRIGSAELLAEHRQTILTLLGDVAATIEREGLATKLPGTLRAIRAKAPTPNAHMKPGMAGTGNTILNWRIKR